MVNCAAVSVWGRVEDVTDEEFDRILHVDPAKLIIGAPRVVASVEALVAGARGRHPSTRGRTPPSDPVRHGPAAVLPGTRVSPWFQ